MHETTSELFFQTNIRNTSLYTYHAIYDGRTKTTIKILATTATTKPPTIAPALTKPREATVARKDHKTTNKYMTHSDHSC